MNGNVWMIWMVRWLALGICSSLSIPLAFAQDILEDPDQEEELGPIEAGVQSMATGEGAAIVGVQRGLYVEADTGVLDFIGTQPTYGFPYSVGQALRAGPVLRMNLGRDWTRGESRFNLATEASLWQSVNKGVLYYVGSEALSPVQGNTTSIIGEAAARFGWRAGRLGRLHLFGRFGAGALFMLQSLSYVPVEGIYSRPAQINPHLTLSFGAGAEYYTRLEHFSFTLLEINVLHTLSVGNIFGVHVAGFKYTF